MGVEKNGREGEDIERMEKAEVRIEDVEMVENKEVVNEDERWVLTRA